MARTRSLGELVRAAAGPAIALMIIGFFGGYALVGPNGVLAWGDYRQELVRKQVELARLEAQKRVVQNRVALLDPRRANPDLADELIRKRLGYSHPDEIIIPMDGDQAAQ
ncbi:septum formation initiator family protein [Sphingomonas sp. ID1715]|nr:septum formation initiator family protein [Sphingomonas sp. ID1715]NNM77940.1 septum formation initiator family protein [Sphingomonas sp. ID1715]